MVQLQKLEPAMFGEIYETFLKDDDPHLTREHWKNLFIYGWDSGEDHFGYVLRDQGRIVGVLGMIFSRRIVDGTTHKICNLHSWYVQEAYRHRSLMLLRPLLKMNDYTITDFTPSDAVFRLTLRLGFQVLDARLRIMLSSGLPRRVRPGGSFLFTRDAAFMRQRLYAGERQILQDHLPYPCQHLLVYNPEQHCYIVFSRVDRFAIPYCFVHFIGNPAMFRRRNKEIRSLLSHFTQTRLVVAHERLLAGMRLPGSFVSGFSAHALYRSPHLQPHQIDTLYADVSLLNLSTFSNLRYQLRRLPRHLRGLVQKWRRPAVKNGTAIAEIPARCAEIKSDKTIC